MGICLVNEFVLQINIDCTVTGMTFVMTLRLSEAL